jgi:hypothetical protein
MKARLIMRSRLWLGTAALLAVAGAVGCGGDSDSDAGKKGAKTQAERPAPPDLVGTYSRTLKRADLPANPPPELTVRAERWSLKIANTGGPGNAPSLTLINDQLGVLEASRIGVIGNRILLHDQGCAAAAATVESEYMWKRSAQTLRFTVVKNGCKDKVALTLLTAGSWTVR